MHFLRKRSALYGFMLATYTERCTSSLSYLLVRLTPPTPHPAHSEAAASFIPARRGQDALPNTATKQKLRLNSQGAIKRAFHACSDDVPLGVTESERILDLLSRPER